MTSLRQRFLFDSLTSIEHGLSTAGVNIFGRQVFSVGGVDERVQGLIIEGFPPFGGLLQFGLDAFALEQLPGDVNLGIGLLEIGPNLRAAGGNQRAGDESDNVEAHPHARRLLELTDASIQIALCAIPAPANSALVYVGSVSLNHLI